MKHMTIKMLLPLLLVASQMQGKSCPTTQGFGNSSIFIPRSQSVNAARDLVGWQRDINQFDAGDYYWTSAVTLQYDRTFQPSRINQYLFQSDSLTFSGSRVPGRNAQTDILADYFGLPGDFESTVCFAPRITNVQVDFANYVGLDRIWKGLYFRWHTPLVNTKWSMNMTETIRNAGAPYLQSGYQAPVTQPLATGTTGFYPAGYMGTNRVTRNELAADVTQAWCSPVTYGDMQTPMKFGKICPCCNTKDMFGDTEMALGWNFLQDDWYHAGLNLRVTLPISDTYQVEYLFQPQIGNGHHTAVGVGWTSHVDVWESKDYEHRIAIYLDANIMHLLSNNQFRSYDLINGAGSRYMLLEEFEPAQRGLISGSVGNNQTVHTTYAGNLVPAINVTTLCSSIRINAEADLALKFSYFRRDGLGIDVGYNLWTRSPEKLTCREKLVENTYGIKGDAMIYGFIASTNNAYGLSATESLATIHGGPNGASNFEKILGSTLSDTFASNEIVDNSVEVGAPTLGLRALSALDILSMFPGSITSASSSVQPILLRDADINEASGLAPRFVSHKFFAHVDYRWQDTESATPFVGIGGQVEVAHTCTLNKAGYAQGTFWVKGGFSY